MSATIAAGDVFRANLRKLVDREGGNPNAASRRLKIPQRSLDRLLKGEREPSLSMIEKIAQAVVLLHGRLWAPFFALD